MPNGPARRMVIVHALLAAAMKFAFRAMLNIIYIAEAFFTLDQPDIMLEK